MPLSRRYTPEVAPGEQSVFGMDFSYVIPKGVGIASGTLAIAPAGLTAGSVAVQARTLYATVTAPTTVSGTDFTLTWSATDTDGNIWPRSAKVLCAPTS
jgi:hypothetical protein